MIKIRNRYSAKKRYFIGGQYMNKIINIDFIILLNELEKCKQEIIAIRNKYPTGEEEVSKEDNIKSILLKKRIAEIGLVLSKL